MKILEPIGKPAPIFQSIEKLSIDNRPNTLLKTKTKVMNHLSSLNLNLSKKTLLPKFSLRKLN